MPSTVVSILTSIGSYEGHRNVRGNQDLGRRDTALWRSATIWESGIPGLGQTAAKGSQEVKNYSS